MIHFVEETTVEKISDEFKQKTKEIFQENLVFAFIFGGIAKGYAKDVSHDIDMFICLSDRNNEQESKFRAFYFAIHNKFNLTPDYTDPGEVVSLSELKNSLFLLENMKISPVMKAYKEYEAIVWGDVFAGKIISPVGNIKLLESIQQQCATYPDKWRANILTQMDQYTLKTEWESIKNLNITRLFRRYVTYLKQKEGENAPSMKVCVLGGGGNVAEAVAANLVANGHQVSQFRFAEQISIRGIPKRENRSLERVSELKFLNVSTQECLLESKKIQCFTSEGSESFSKFDLFIFAYPSYMAEVVAKRLGNKIAGKPLINLSDRFLGTYSFIFNVNKLYGSQFLPSVAVAFNGVPIMALKPDRNSPTHIYYIKPKHSIAWYPQTREGRTAAYKLLIDLFKFESSQLIPYSSMLHLGFENAHCIEHAVVDLYNLQKEKYQTGNFLYSPELYDKEVLAKVEQILNERDQIANRVVGRSFASLKDYDIRVFGSGGNPDLALAGTSAFRITHDSLSKAPSMLRTTAFGYEDIGWSMVTLESFAKAFAINTPNLTTLINEWNYFMGCDYRTAGRTINTLDLLPIPNVHNQTINDYRDLNFLPNFMTNEARQAILYAYDKLQNANDTFSENNPQIATQEQSTKDDNYKKMHLKL